MELSCFLSPLGSGGPDETLHLITASHTAGLHAGLVWVRSFTLCFKCDLHQTPVWTLHSPDVTHMSHSAACLQKWLNMDANVSMSILKPIK